MARVSSAPEDAFHFKGSFQDGWGEVTDAKALVFQFPPTKADKATPTRPEGSQDPPSLVLSMSIQRYQDGDFTQKVGSEPEEVLLSIQRPDKMTGELSACHPGNYPDGNVDADPVDASGDLGAEGNTLFAIQDGYQLNDKVKYMRFTQSLQEKGFKPGILKRTYFPDFIGLRAYFHTVTEKRPAGFDTDPTVFVVKEIKQFPYEKAAAGSAGTTAGKAVAATGKSKGKQAVQSETIQALKASSAPASETVSGSAASGTNGTANIEEIAQAVVMETLVPAKKGVILNDVKRLTVEAFLAVAKHKPAVANEYKKAVNDQLKDEAWLVAIGEAHNVYSVGEDGKVTFAK